jgi:capsular exopolysaccharide synthesis family protein
MKELNLTFSYQSNNIRKIDEAIPPKIVYKPNKQYNYIIGTLLGLVMSGFMVFLLEHLDEKVRDPKEFCEIFQAPLFGSVPYIAPKYTQGIKALQEDDKSPLAEAFRAIGTSIFFSEKERQSYCFVVSSPMASDGKTTVTCNLGCVISQAGYKILLLDIDLRRPKVHERLGIKNSQGVSDILQGTVSYKDCIQVIDDNLHCITAGCSGGDPYQIIYQSNLADILAQMQQEYKYIIIDSPPTVVTDAYLLSQATKNLLLVLPTAYHNRGSLQQIAERIRTLGVPLQGFILNNKTKSALMEQKHYSYDYSSSYYS